MPFRPRETVNMRFEGDPHKAQVHFCELDYTTANGGLRVEEDGGLIWEVAMPSEAGEYPYQFSAGRRKEAGMLRVIEARIPETAPPAAEIQGGGFSYGGR